MEHSRKGAIEGADRDDWPITCADLEQYYTRVDWEIGVSGLADPIRSNRRTVIHDFYQLDPKLGIDGGGGLDLRMEFLPITFAMFGPLDAPTWGMEYKHMLRDYFTKTLYVLAHTTQLPVASNAISLVQRSGTRGACPPFA